MNTAHLKISELIHLGCYGVEDINGHLRFNAWSDTGRPLTDDDVRAGTGSIPALGPYSGCQYLSEASRMRIEHVHRIRWLMAHPARWSPIHFELSDCGTPELIDGHHTLAAAAMLKHRLITFTYGAWSSAYRFQFAASYAAGLFRARA